MAADVTVAAALTVPIIMLGLLLGVRFEAGPLGIVAFIAVAALWSLAFAGFGYAIALKTGNPAAVNSTFLFFFPFLFLTTSYVPRQRADGMAEHRGGVQPGHLLLAGLRSVDQSAGWHWTELGQALLAIGVVGADQHVALLRRPAGSDQAGRELRSAWPLGPPVRRLSGCGRGDIGEHRTAPRARPPSRERAVPGPHTVTSSA